MRIIFVSSEVVPYAKTGGLADVLGTLPHEIAKLGHEVMIFLPRYKTVDIKDKSFKVEIDRLSVSLSSEKESGRIYSQMAAHKVKVFFVDHPEFFCRDGLYGTALGDYPDNDRRFTFFQRAALETLIELKMSPDVIHCHDWQTGLIPVYLKTLYAKKRVFQKTRSVYTIHNLAYQGNFPPDSMPATGLGWEHFKLQRLEFYGKMSFLKGGILDADAVTTVSQQYAKEIKTEEFGCGLDGVLAARSGRLKGILNGIDPEEWNPEKDSALSVNYSIANLALKAKNKAALQKENEIKVDAKAPLVGLVSRLVDQKGVDILISALPSMMEMGLQFVLLGTGDEKYHHFFRQFAKKYSDQCGIHIVFDMTMAKRIYAGCDMMLLPSYYEPCGLGQMIALRFGTIPIVREIGGLVDTVQEYEPHRKRGNGFSFRDYTSEALLDVTRRAVKVFRNKEDWRSLMQNAMGCDFSWAVSAKQYVDLYETTKKRVLKDF